MFGFSIKSLIYSLICGVIVITIFEFTKAAVAKFLGDNTSGRFTLNPLKHIEPVGLILLIFFGFGWGKPVEVRPGNFKDRKKGVIITYAAPIVISIVISLVLKLISQILGYNLITGYLSMFAAYFIKIAIFNIVPVYPLCGSYILKACMKPNNAIKFAQNEKILQLIVIFAIITGIGSNVINFIVSLIFGW